MRTPSSLSELAKARLTVVEEHIGHENRHDLGGIMSTFGEDAQVGLYHEPVGFFGQVVTGLTHPLTVARAYLRMLFRRSA